MPAAFAQRGTLLFVSKAAQRRCTGVHGMHSQVCAAKQAHLRQLALLPGPLRFRP